MSIYNAYCVHCKKDRIVDDEKARCIVCNKKLKILGERVRLTATNGEFNKHL